MAMAVYGKHPAKGDFLEYGLPLSLKPALEGWLDTALADAKASLGADWQTVWPTAPMLRFWLGEGIWGTPVAGVLAPSQDRVGRRFPLVLLALGDGGMAVSPPVIDADQAWYDAACVHLGVQLLRDDLPGPAALVQDAPQPPLTNGPPGPADFWAVRPGADVDGLLADIALTDHRRANQGRSYWWVAGTAAVADDAALLVDLAKPAAEDDSFLPVGAEAEVEADGAADGVAADEQAVEPASDADADAGGNSDGNTWDLPDTPETDGSPFDIGDGDDDNVKSMFAPPEPAGIATETAYTPPQTPAPDTAKPQWSQVWAGPGLPPGAVLAWFFRGHAGND